MNKPELKPCPFCGSEADIWKNTPNTIIVQCRRCSATTSVVNLYKEGAYEKAAEMWNRRVEANDNHSVENVVN